SDCDSINNINDCYVAFNNSQNKTCYLPAPVITSTEPKKSLISGGTNITILGQNFIGCHSSILQLQNNQTLEKCEMISSTNMSCKTRKMTGIFNRTTTTNLSFTTNENCMETYMFTIKEDPIFDDKMYTISKNKDILIIEGKDIPTELEKEIIIKIGSTTCRVVDVNKHRIVCRAKKTVEIAEENRKNQTNLNSSKENNTSTTPSTNSTHNASPVAAGVINTNGVTKPTVNKSAQKKIILDDYSNATVTIEIGYFSQVLGYLKVDLEEPGNDLNKTDLFIGVATFISLIVTGILLVIVIVVKLKKMKQLLDNKQPTLESILHSVVDKEKLKNVNQLILNPKDITLGNLIGSGNFGCVYDGVLCKDQLKVAVKTMQDTQSAQLKEFIIEALIMKDFEHPNVLKLIGMAEKDPGVPYVILPFMDNGDLLTYVRNESLDLSLHDVIKFGADIASGMAYLGSLKFVHRDLAARNCMLDSSLTVKVADFGLCRDIYEKGYYSSDNKKVLPVRWMAIECIDSGSYTTKSDVWSLGVVLWELLTRGMTPYPGVDGWDIINYLRHRRLAMPFFCPDRLYYLMMLCWAKDPKVRPSFSVIEKELLRMIKEESPQSLQCSTKLSRGDITGFHESEGVLESLQETITSNETVQPIDNNSSEPQSFGCNKSVTVTTDIELIELSNKTISEGNYIKLSESSCPEVDSERNENHYINILSVRYKGLVNNVGITQPACYSDREVSREEAGVYVHLVDHYQTIPNFKRLEMVHNEKSPDTDNKQEFQTGISEDERLKSAVNNDLSYFELEPSRRSSASIDEEIVQVHFQVV
ncbi:hypothetical protein Btru_066622, partial [Bulinus truncatus]